MPFDSHRPQDAPLAPVSPRSWPNLGLKVLALVALGLAGLVVGIVVLPHSATVCQATPLDDRLPVPLRDWAKPDVVLVVSGQMHGYINPCGCSKPQFGGLIRRYNFIDVLRRRGWPVVGLDLGELNATSGLREQDLAKLQLTMKSLDLMNYRAVGIGKNELKTPLLDVLGVYSINSPRPRPLALNLDEAWAPGVYDALNVRPWEIIRDVQPRLGVFSMIGSDLRDEFKGEKFRPVNKALPAAMDAFAKEGVDFGIVMYHEYPTPPASVPNVARWVEEERHKRAAACAEYCNKLRQQNSRVPVMGLVLSLTEESEPPAQLMGLPGNVPAKLLEIGHKGRFVGVVGIYRKGNNYELKYQLVAMGPEFEEPAVPGVVSPALNLQENYTRQLERDNLLAKVARTPHHTQIDPILVKRGIKAKFVGSDTCSGCHPAAAKVWAESRHSHALDSLRKAEKPAHRQFDPECVVCHTVGFRHPTGYYDAPPDKLAKHNKKLENVGCESCHGPGSAHANNPDDATLYPLINPFRASETERKAEATAEDSSLPAAQRAAAKAIKDNYAKHRMDQVDFRLCQKCHDIDNDVNWANTPFMQKWLGGNIAHPTPRRPAAAQAPQGGGIDAGIDRNASIQIEAAPVDEKK